MSKSKLVLAMCLCACMLCGCLGSGSGGNADGDAAQAAAPAEDTAAAPEADAKKPAKGQKGQKDQKGKKGKVTTQAEAKAQLDATAKKLVSNAAKTVTPNINNKAVSKVGKEYVAKYTSIDVNSVSTDVRPTNTPGHYVGTVRYMEHFYECRGKTKAEALKASCSRTHGRRMSELIHYDGKKWTY